MKATKPASRSRHQIVRKNCDGCASSRWDRALHVWSVMATYVNLMKFTDQGMRTVSETVSRAEKYWAAIKEAGGHVVQQVWTTGEYDVVTMFEAPNDETAAALALQGNALGNVRMTTTRAFTAEEVQRILTMRS